MQGKLSEVSNPNISDAGSKNVTENKKKSRKPAVIAVASVAAVAVLAGGGWFVWKTYANHELAEARQACVEASESYRKAADSYSGLVDGDAATASQITVKQVADAKTVDALAEALKANEPDVVACVADSKADYESKNSLIEKNTGWYGKHEKSLEEAVKAVNDSKLEKTVSDAERLLKDSDGKVADAATHDELSKAVKARDADKIAAASKKVNDSVTQYIFLLALVLLASLIAALIGLEGILGAFFAGLVLNRFVPTRSPLMARIKFVGNAIFIPYFLIGVGMLINVGAIFSGWATAWIALVMTATALVSKWVAAWMSQKVFRLTAVDRRVMFGLTSGKAAATIAATMIGFNYGFIDEGVMNGAILMILACCLVSTVVTERNAIRLRMELTAADLREEGEYMQGAYSRQLVAVANPVTAENIMRMAVMMRHRNNRSRVVALFIRTDDNAYTLAMGRNALRAAVAQALAVDLEVADVERYDLNVVNGLISVALENHSSDIIIGMHRRSNIVDTFYGSLIEQLLKASNKMIFMSRCFIPVDTVGRLFVVVPDKAEYETGFKAWVERVGNLASQLACRVVFIATDATFRFISNILADENYAVRLDFMAAESFDDFIIASAQLDPDDLLIVVGARKGSISHSSMLDAIPSYLQKNFSSQNLLVVYPEQFNG